MLNLERSGAVSKPKLFEVLKYAKTNGMNEMLSNCYSFLGDFYSLNGNPVQGCIAYQKAAEIAEAIGFLADHKALNSKIFDCLRNQEKHQEASLALLKYIETNDSLHHIERNEILNRSIDRYEQKEIREDRIDLAQNQRLFELKNRRSNFTLYGLLFSIASILLAGFIIILFYQQKLSANEIIHSQNEQINQQKITELENNLTLQTMKSMIAGQEEERERIAKDLHDSLGGLLSTIKLRFDKLQSDPMHEKIDSTIAHGQEQMDHAVDHLKKELTKIRTGKAATGMLDGLLVEYYGGNVPLAQVANVGIADARTITIQPWEKGRLAKIEHAIFAANMVVTPMNDGEIIRISIPPLTEERRRDLAKQAKVMGEDAKVALRQIRHKVMDFIKKEIKDGYPEDMGKKKEADVDKMVHTHTDAVDHLIAAKEKDIMTV